MNNANSRNRRRQRRLVCESLESRQLMASDLIYHNFMMPEDSDMSGDVTPLDALMVINQLNAGGSIGANNVSAALDGLLKKGAESLTIFDEILSSKKRLLGETHPDLLFTKMGLAGAYTHQLRLVEAERLYASVLEDQRRLIGESHPQTLQCLEKLLVVLGQLDRYPEAIQLCKEYLSHATQRYPGSPNAHRVMHSCIEYHIVQGKTLEAKTFFEQSQEWIDQFGLSPDWMINDLPFLAYSQIQSGQLDAAEASIKQLAKNCDARLGATHPMTMQAEFQWMKFLNRREKNEEASQLLKKLKSKLEAIEAVPEGSEARLALIRAMLSGHHEELAAYAAKAGSQGNWLKAIVLYSHCVSIAAEQIDCPKEVTEVLAEKAFEALDQVFTKGMITKRRELSMLTATADHERLRNDPRFPQRIVKIEALLTANSLLGSAWSHAIAGNHIVAKSEVEELLSLKVDGEQGKLISYNTGCVFARCYEAALREVGRQHDFESSKADEYLQLSISSFAGCWQSGYLTSSDLVAQLKKDDDLVAIRSTEAFQALLQKMTE
jgi:Tetratricopeptide repeat